MPNKACECTMIDQLAVTHRSDDMCHSHLTISHLTNSTHSLCHRGRDEFAKALIRARHTIPQMAKINYCKQQAEVLKSAKSRRALAFSAPLPATH